MAERKKIHKKLQMEAHRKQEETQRLIDMLGPSRFRENIVLKKNYIDAMIQDTTKRLKLKTLLNILVSYEILKERIEHALRLEEKKQPMLSPSSDDSVNPLNISRSGESSSTSATETFTFRHKETDAGNTTYSDLVLQKGESGDKLEPIAFRTRRKSTDLRPLATHSEPKLDESSKTRTKKTTNRSTNKTGSQSKHAKDNLASDPSKKSRSSAKQTREKSKKSSTTKHIEITLESITTSNNSTKDTKERKISSSVPEKKTPGVSNAIPTINKENAKSTKRKRSESPQRESKIVKKAKTYPKTNILNNRQNVHCLSEYMTRCCLCGFKDKKRREMVQHYVHKHRSNDVFVSRITPEEGNKVKRSPFEVSGERVISRYGTNAIYFGCHFCEMRCTLEKQDWIEHTMKHTGEFRYRCAGCFAMGCKLDDPIRHAKDCHNPSMFVYNDVFFEDNHLYAYMCELCNFVQLRRNNMELHLRKQHHRTATCIRFSLVNFRPPEQTTNASVKRELLTKQTDSGTSNEVVVKEELLINTKQEKSDQIQPMVEELARCQNFLGVPKPVLIEPMHTQRTNCEISANGSNATIGTGSVDRDENSLTGNKFSEIADEAKCRTFLNESEIAGNMKILHTSAEKIQNTLSSSEQRLEGSAPIESPRKAYQLPQISSPIKLLQEAPVIGTPAKPKENHARTALDGNDRQKTLSKEVPIMVAQQTPQQSGTVIPDQNLKLACSRGNIFSPLSANALQTSPRAVNAASLVATRAAYSATVTHNMEKVTGENIRAGNTALPTYNIIAPSHQFAQQPSDYSTRSQNESNSYPIPSSATQTTTTMNATHQSHLENHAIAVLGGNGKQKTPNNEVVPPQTPQQSGTVIPDQNLKLACSRGNILSPLPANALQTSPRAVNAASLVATRAAYSATVTHNMEKVTGENIRAGNAALPTYNIIAPSHQFAQQPSDYSTRSQNESNSYPIPSSATQTTITMNATHRSLLENHAIAVLGGNGKQKTPNNEVVPPQNPQQSDTVIPDQNLKLPYSRGNILSPLLANALQNSPRAVNAASLVATRAIDSATISRNMEGITGGNTQAASNETTTTMNATHQNHMENHANAVLVGNVGEKTPNNDVPVMVAQQPSQQSITRATTPTGCTVVPTNNIPAISYQFPCLNKVALKPWIADNISVMRQYPQIIMLPHHYLRSFYKCMGINCSYNTDERGLMKHHLHQHFYFEPQSSPAQILDWLECCYCDYRATEPEQLLQHMGTAHKFCAFQCNRCLYRSREASSAFMHQCMYHVGHDSSNRILFCSKQYKSYNLQDQQIIMTAMNHFVKPLNCTACGDRRFLCGSSLAIHLLTHGNDYIGCLFCQQSIRACDMMQHLRLHQIHLYQCVYCGFGTAIENEMRHHVTHQHAGHIFCYHIREIQMKNAASSIQPYVRMEPIIPNGRIIN